MPLLYINNYNYASTTRMPYLCGLIGVIILFAWIGVITFFIIGALVVAVGTAVTGTGVLFKESAVIGPTFTIIFLDGL